MIEFLVVYFSKEDCDEIFDIVMKMVKDLVVEKKFVV